MSSSRQQKPGRNLGCDGILSLRSYWPGHQKDTSLTGDIRRHTIDSVFLGGEREYRVYLPPGYSADDPWLYPVLFLNDGQNIFDRETAVFGVEWEVDESAERLIRDRQVEPLVAVAVYNSHKRVIEYTPFVDRNHGGGYADVYGKFLIDELMPELRKLYNITSDPEKTAIAGSSLGGLCALYLAWRHPKVFGRVAAISPSLWWAARAMITFVGGQPGSKGPSKIWLDMGTEECSTDTTGNQVPDVLEDVRTLRAVLVYNGYVEDQDLFYREIEGGRHNERSWAQRVEDILKVLYPMPESMVHK